MNNSPKFRDSKGNLAAYSFICGYVEEKIKNNILTEIFIYGGTRHYNIRRFNSESLERLSWDTAKTLKEARKIANSF